MSGFELFVKGLGENAPWAILVGAVGAVWQLIFTYTRDKAAARESLRTHALEQAKFENQKALERLRFDYEQRKWREQLALQLAFKHVDERLKAYPPLWEKVRAVARHYATAGVLTRDAAREIAAFVEQWRYSSGGLLAEETTREAALAFQTALWHYDTSAESLQRVLVARQLLRAALRADMGLGEDAFGTDIFDTTAQRHKLAASVESLKAELQMPERAAD